MQLVDELGLADRVTLTGFRDDAVRVMGACDIFTLASQWEGLPVALMEALALGLPVVATEVGGVAEEMHDGTDALLVPPKDSVALADAIERVATDPALREQLGAAAFARASDFDVHRAVERIEAAYTELAPEAAAEPAVPKPAPTRRPLPQGLDIREATPADRPAIIELCRASLGWGDDPRFEQLFSWKHDQNAFGPSYMWVATDGGKIVGLRAFMRWEFVRGGEVLHAVRAVDTATHPDYQGKGLFTAMTMHGLDVIKDDGIDFVFNTPNDKSRPGYLKMGWQEVGKLPVAIRVAGPRVAMRVARSRVASSHWPIEVGLGVPVTDVVSELALATLDDGPDRRRSPRTSAPSSTSGATAPTSSATGRSPATVVISSAVFGERGDAKELVMLDSPGLDTQSADRTAARLLTRQGLDHALRIGAPDCPQRLRARPGRTSRHLAIGVREGDAAARELACRHGRRGAVLSGHRPRVIVLLSSNARRGAEIEGVGLVDALSSHGLDARALALTSTTSSAKLDVPVLGDGALAVRTLRRLRAEARSSDLIIAYGSKTLPACSLGLFGLDRRFVYRSIGDPRSWVRDGWHVRRTRLLMRRAHRAAVLWPGAADSVADLYGVPASQISVIPNGRSVSDFHPPSQPERLEARRSLGLEDDAQVVAFVGSLVKEKRIALAIDAVARTKSAHLLVAGGGPDLDDAWALATRLDARTTFLGPVSDVRPVLASADMVLSTSSTEGMPGALIEAALCGVPSVATAVGAVPWLFEMGMRGVCLPIGAEADEIASAIEMTLASTTRFSTTTRRGLLMASGAA